MAQERGRGPQAEIVYGINPVCELLRAGRRKIVGVYTTRPVPRNWSSIEPFLKKRAVRVQYVDRAKLARLAGCPDHQGVVAVVHPFPFKKDPFDAKKHPYIILLDGIQDPRNIGAIVRSAYCAGVDGVLIIRKGTAPISSVALKASAGLAEHVPVRMVPSAAAALQEVKQAGYHLYVATFGGKAPEEYGFEQPLCLALGGEGSGVSSQIARAGNRVTIAQRAPHLSYNVSVAAGILLFAIGRKNNRI